jgi:hypothetical protein
MEQGFLSQPWTAVRDSVHAKLIEQDGELYVLARSAPRRDKEQAIRQRRLADIAGGLKHVHCAGVPQNMRRCLFGSKGGHHD